MFHSVVVPLDGSAFGEHAFPLALEIVQRSGGTLHLVHVHPRPDLPFGLGGMPYIGDPDNPAARDQEQAYLNGVADRLLQQANVPISCALTAGPVARTLEECIGSVCADLVVMSTHAHAGLTRLRRNRIAEKCANSLEVPILLVRGDETAAPEQAPELGHILIPLDGSEFAETMIPFATSLGRRFDASFTLLRVIPPPVITSLIGSDAHGHYRMKEAHSVAQRYLDRVAERMRKDGLRVETQVVGTAQPAAAIAEFAAANEIDLIAMEAHPRGSLARMLGQSVADGVLRGSTVPVLIHHPDDAEQTDETADDDSAAASANALSDDSEAVR